ncbi:Methionyl-tRNA synthetase [Elusimicrobium minutum Pei191]|uniref:Methionine--tRNA ligase n=1 Tax=Elusimicrobium minutum (strain Pei191) TaxID=445932 RepID=B2KER1_ELUMP|nr:methionine--tRNA ligase [Elusimicrobium minutum]ACC99007.1 Methionyl-tRNA synthetase [Elusimicrobium minutum Pei191]
MTKKFYITTPIYYVNAYPHIGHSYTTLACDIVSRYKRSRGEEVHFLTGTDEHGINIEKAAEKAGMSPKAWCDQVVDAYKELWKILDIKYDDFIRTTDKRHEETVQQIFEILIAKGDIYLGHYSGMYCNSCEAYMDETEAPEGICPIHKKPLTEVKEETYFFKLSKYQDALLKFYESNPSFLNPKFRSAEITNFVKSGLKDLSVTRTKVAWGIPVKSNPKHTIYVWFDALINYASAAGLGLNICEDKEFFKEELKKVGLNSFEDVWPADVHLIGKEIARFHMVIWPAMLMALGIPTPKKVFAHGWWTVEGEKMSKTLGNIVDPKKVADEYGLDPLRFFLFREVPFGADGDFSMDSFIKRYNADLANDLGNLLSRTLNMAVKYGDLPAEGEYKSPLLVKAANVDKAVEEHMSELALDKTLEAVWSLIGDMNRYIDETKPWALAKTDEAAAKNVIIDLIHALRKVAVWVEPFMPATGAEMKKRLAPGPVQKYAPLFPRLEVKK